MALKTDLSRLRKIACLFSVCAVTLSLLTACDDPTPLKIGFSGSLSGRASELGKAGRDGVMLAVEEAMAAGGINGRALELIINDDGNTPETALKADHELINQGVVAILGHMTSSLSMATVPLANEHGIVLLSPTTATEALSEKDDYFIRVIPDSKGLVEGLVKYAFEKKNVHSLTSVIDINNQAYAESLLNAYQHNLKELGGSLTQTFQYNSSNDRDFEALANQIIESDGDGVFIVANSQDTALICQNLKKMNYSKPIIASLWSVSGNIIEHGGHSVDDILFNYTFSPDDKSDRFTALQKRFLERFQYELNFPALYSYDAAMVLIEALKKNPDPKDLKQTILSLGPVNGGQVEILIDHFGDVKRKLFTTTIRNGQFVTLE